MAAGCRFGREAREERVVAVGCRFSGGLRCGRERRPGRGGGMVGVTGAPTWRGRRPGRGIGMVGTAGLSGALVRQRVTGLVRRVPAWHKGLQCGRGTSLAGGGLTGRGLVGALPRRDGCWHGPRVAGLVEWAPTWRGRRPGRGVTGLVEVSIWIAGRRRGRGFRCSGGIVGETAWE